MRSLYTELLYNRFTYKNKSRRMKFTSKEKDLTPSELIELEKLYSIKLPKSYKEFMIKNNGMRPLREYFFKPEIWDNDIEIFNIFSIKYGSSTFEKYNINIGLGDYPEGKVTIGRSRTGNFSMSVKKDDYGSIYVYYSDGEMHKLASSFSEFLEGFKEL